MNLPQKVKLVEVGPRDGLQNEAKPVPAEVKETDKQEDLPPNFAGAPA